MFLSARPLTHEGQRAGNLFIQSDRQILGLGAGVAHEELILQRGSGINWPLAFVTGIIGSFVGGLFASFVAGDGLELRPSGIIGSIFGATVVTLLWDWIQRRRGPKKEEHPRPHVGS